MSRTVVPHDTDMHIQNLTTFLKYVASEYSKILHNSSCLLRNSAEVIPPKLEKFTAGEEEGELMDVQDDWNIQYVHAQKVLNVCRNSLRFHVLQEDYSLVKVLDFNFFKTIIEKNTGPFNWFKLNNSVFAPDVVKKLNLQISKYKAKIHHLENRFLADVIQNFIFAVTKDISEEEREKLHLLPFQFSNSDVTPWVEFFKNPNTETKLPRLPSVCIFKYSQSNSNENQVLDLFQKFKSTYNTWNPNDFTRYTKIDDEIRLRTLFHARAWLAFRKAIHDALPDNMKEKDRYKSQNLVKKQEDTYTVLGSAMSVSLASRELPKYLVRIEH